jgi:hypothetical protein
MRGFNFSARAQRLFDAEEISRGEIYAAFLVAARMLSFAWKRVTPVMRYMPKGSSRRPPALAAPPPQFSDAEGDDDGCQDANPGEECGFQTVVRLYHKDVQPFSPHGAPVAGAATWQPTEAEEDQYAHTHRPSPSGFPPAQAPSRQLPTPPTQRAMPRYADPAMGREEEVEEEISVKKKLSPVAAAPAASAPPMGRLGPGGRPGHQRVLSEAPTVELLGLDARNVDCSGKCNVKYHDLSPQWDFFKNPALATERLNKGEVLYAFRCFKGSDLSEDDRRVLQPVTDISSFPNEPVDNNSPHINLSDPAEASKYTLIVNKSMYLIPNLRIEDISAEKWSSRHYCERCIPGNPKFSTDAVDANTIRFYKPLIKFVFSILVQLKISTHTDPAVMEGLTQVDGFTPARCLLYERTKRDKSKTDMTAKVKSLLMYVPVTGGVLLSHVVVVYNTSIPGVVAALVNNFGGQGATESADTAALARKYVKEFLPATR